MLLGEIMVKLSFVILMKKWQTISDEYAPEHLEVQTENLEWFSQKTYKLWFFIYWRRKQLFAYGDKCSGTNHILPTKGAGRYTGGLFVGKFVKTLSFSKNDKRIY